jgi:FlaA1/EpsC-like NDP-sugar epimerase
MQKLYKKGEIPLRPENRGKIFVLDMGEPVRIVASRAR